MDLKKTLANAGRKLFPAAEKLYNLGTKIANSPEALRKARDNYWTFVSGY